MSAGAGIGKAAGELMQEMQKAQQAMQQMEQNQQAGQAGGAHKFDQVMATQVQQANQAQQVTQTQQIQATPQAHNILMSARTGMVDPSLGVQRVPGADNAAMKNMVKGLAEGQNKMEKIMDLALSGRQFSPQEMLIMQAGVMRYSQEIELTGKVIDKATQGIKQTMNTQV
jgi:type III secretion system YscI/HrpB-like protein